MCDLPGIDRYKLASDPEHGEPVPEREHKPYLVAVADVCGVFIERTYATFDEALVVYVRMQDAHPKCVTTIANTDRCEYDGERWFNGLTPEEEEQL